MTSGPKAITDVKVRMYKLGTGDCFTVKFLSGGETTFSMMFDCGCFTGSKSRLSPFVTTLINDMEGHVDVLVVTHEHQDHVLGFQRCEDLFVGGLSVGEIWLGWTEEDSKPKVRRWKQEYGDKKMALARAAKRLKKEVNSKGFESQLEGNLGANELLAMHRNFAGSVKEFAELHVNEEEREYKGPLAGMSVVKKGIERQEITYLFPGDVFYDIEGMEGVKIYVLGPPLNYREVEMEEGEAGESFQHNEELNEEDFALDSMRARLDGSDFFARTVNASGSAGNDPTLTAFPSSFHASRATLRKSGYLASENDWRRIDTEWLQSSAHLALRMNSLTNNLSVVLAIEFEESGKVLLFPGDAEIGSWKSWHTIDWRETLPDSDRTTEELLNNTIFYKVAHHLSHNGTAKSVGLEMMNHPDLVAMATLNYDVIASGWKTTMPNRAILKSLLERTQGRTIVQNIEGLFFDPDENVPLEPKIDEYRERMSRAERENFENSIRETRQYIEINLEI